MVLHHIKQDLTKEITYNDSLIAKTQLLISDLLRLESQVGAFLDTHITVFSVLNDDEYLSWSISRFPEGSDAHDNLAQTQKLFRRQRAMKIKDRDCLIAYAKLKNEVAKMKAEHKEKAEKDMKRHNISELLYFCNGKKLALERVFNQDGKGLDLYIKKMKYVLCESNFIPVLELDPTIFPDNVEWGKMKGNIGVDKLPDFISLLLYEIPDISDLTHEQLDYMRSNIHEKVKSFNSRIDELQQACKNVEYKEENWNEIKTMFSEKNKWLRKITACC